MTHILHIKSPRALRLAVASLFVAIQVPIAWAGTAAAQTNSSDFRINMSQNNSTAVENDTEIQIDNSTSQTAVSGNIELDGVTTAGDITTGDASNQNVTEAAVAVMADITVPNAPDSENVWYRSASMTSVENETSVHISNQTQQSAVSGSISLNDIRQVGDITTGDVSNENCTSVRIAIASASPIAVWPASTCAAQTPVTPPDEGGSVLGESTSTSGGQGEATVAAVAQLANTGGDVMVGLFAALAIIGLVSTAAVTSRQH